MIWYIIQGPIQYFPESEGMADGVNTIILLCLYEITLSDLSFAISL